MEFEKVPTIPTADELIDRALHRAAVAKKLKINKERADEEFVRAVYSSLYDKLDDSVKKFPTLEDLPQFYKDIVNVLFSIDKMRKSLGALSWAGNQVRTVGTSYARQMRGADDTRLLRKQATARMASIVHQVDSDLRYLNEARNVLRKLPEISEDFTVVVAGYPNVGKSSFIKLISSADPEIAGYAFTTKQVVVGHRIIGRERIQIVDTPGLLDRPLDERNYVEKQALAAITNVADIILFIIDASESCGYSLSDQLHLLDKVREMTEGVPVEVVVNKSDMQSLEGYPNMSTTTEEGVDEVISLILKYWESSPRLQ